MKRWIALGAIAVSLYGVWMRGWDRWGDRSLRITFFDVGQGDAALVQAPGGRTWLIDAGGGEPGRDLGARVLFPELSRLGVLTLDEAVLSHPDQDHGLGFESVFQDLTVRGFRFNRGFLGEPGLMGTLRSRALGARIPLRPVFGEEGERFTGGEVKYLALRGAGTRNDRTLLAWFHFGGCGILFTGDMEEKGEAEWLSKWSALPIDLLKVPHHGSLTSSTPALLDRIRPQWAVISVGRGNTYGHPRPQILERYRYRAIPVWRTDFHGYLRFRIFSDGKVTCESAQGPCGEGRCQATSN